MLAKNMYKIDLVKRREDLIEIFAAQNGKVKKKHIFKVKNCEKVEGDCLYE